MEQKISQIQKEYLEKIGQAQSLKELDEIYLSLFGKKGEVALLPKQFPGLEKDKRRKIGPLFNELKQKLEKAVEMKRSEVREESYKKLEEEKFTLQGVPLEAGGLFKAKKRQGHLHLATQFKKEIKRWL